MRPCFSFGLLCLSLAGCANFDKSVEVDGDAEPVDPAEQRPAIIPPVQIERGPGVAWIELGPAPTFSAQVRVPPDNEVSGAVHALAPHPSSPDVLYIASVNGGVWRTNDARAARPSWAPLTDAMPSQSIGAISFDPTDASFQTLIAGLGRWSNFAQRGDDELGVYRTTDGGVSWSLLGGTTLLGQKMVGVAARGPNLLAASFNGGLFRSSDTGSTWTSVASLPAGGIHDLVADPSSPDRLYAAVRNGTVHRSEDFGVTWTDVTAGLTDVTPANSRIRIAVGPGQAVFVIVVNAGRIVALMRSPNRGGSWVALDEPAIHPGGQGGTNTSIVADPVDNNVVYIAGDRITVGPFTGNVARVNAGLALGSQATSVVDGGANNTAPHADSRAMVFDAGGELLQSDDGGVYRLRNPGLSTRTWASVNGNLNVMEVHDLDHDRVSNVITIGTQDNGTHMQVTAGDPRWRFINGGDGGDVVVDDRDRAPASGLRFISSQDLGGFRRVAFNASNTQTASTTMPNIPTADKQFVTPTELSFADESRLLVGGLNNVYESTNADTAAPTLSNLGGPGANRNAMTYGATGAADVAYVGRGAAVHYRAPGTSSFVATSALPAGAATITDVAMDPGNSNIVFAIDDNQVFRSTNAGATWTDVTGNLPSVSSVDFRTIEFLAGRNEVALGTRSGVYIARADSASWSELGTALPDVLVFDLRYVRTTQTLYAGTLGRGVWSHQFDSDGVFANGFE